MALGCTWLSLRLLPLELRLIPAALDTCASPAARRAALHCNHRWALDGCDPASYAGVLWCFGGCSSPSLPFVAAARPIKCMHLSGLSNCDVANVALQPGNCVLSLTRVCPPPIYRPVRCTQGQPRHPHQRQPGAAQHGGACAPPAPGGLRSAAGLTVWLQGAQSVMCNVMLCKMRRQASLPNFRAEDTSHPADKMCKWAGLHVRVLPTTKCKVMSPR